MNATTPEWKPFDDLLVLVVHDVDHVALNPHQHLLGPGTNVIIF
jgi:hypothetical protein